MPSLYQRVRRSTVLVAMSCSPQRPRSPSVRPRRPSVPDLAGKADHRLLGGERRHPGRQRHRRQLGYPRVERLSVTRIGSRSTSARPAPSTRHPELRGRLRAVVPGAGLDQRHHDRHRRHPDAGRHGTGRYVRALGQTRATGWGYSLWEFQVFGTQGTTNAPTGTLISPFKDVTASSWEGGNVPGLAVDGRPYTRWSSQISDPQWIRVDLGAPAR